MARQQFFVLQKSLHSLYHYSTDSSSFSASFEEHGMLFSNHNPPPTPFSCSFSSFNFSRTKIRFNQKTLFKVTHYNAQHINATQPKAYIAHKYKPIRLMATTFINSTTSNEKEQIGQTITSCFSILNM